MSNEITEINVKVPRKAELPDGIYTGTWGGSIITLRYQDVWYELKTKEGVRGMNIPVVVTIKNSIATFDQLKNR